MGEQQRFKVVEPEIETNIRKALGEIDPPATSAYQPISLGDLLTKYPRLREPAIEGLARRGEIINIVAKSKVGKSWLAYYLLFCMVCGWKLFGRFQCRQSRVLLIDNELHREVISFRLRTVAEALGIDWPQLSSMMDIISLRGCSVDVKQMDQLFAGTEPGKYGLIVVDALYRTLPTGTQENGNSDMTEVYNRLDKYAAMCDAPISVIHHASKGNQGEKDVTDVGAGAGAQSRAADTHLVLRPHQDEGCIVLDAALRSWAPVEPMVLRWEYPIWRAAEDLDPTALKGKTKRYDEQQKDKDETDKVRIENALRQKPQTIKGLTGVLGMGAQRMQRLVGAMYEENRVTSVDVKLRGQECKQYSLVSPTRSDWN